MAMTKEQMAEAVQRRQQAKKFPFTPEQYLDMKADGLSDAKIMQKYELNGVKLNQWKHEHNLIRKEAIKTPAAEPPKLDDETKSKLSGLKDKLNTPKTSQEPQDEPVEPKTTVSVPDVKKTAPVDSGELQKALQRMTAKVEQLEGKLERVNQKNAELSAENEKLYQEKPAEPDLSIVEELKSENAGLRAAADHLELAQSEIHALTEQVRELQRYKADYTALEQLYRETRARLHAVEEENAALTSTETEHIQLMRRHVQLYDRMQGVYGG